MRRGPTTGEWNKLQVTYQVSKYVQKMFFLVKHHCSIFNYLFKSQNVGQERGIFKKNSRSKEPKESFR